MENSVLRCRGEIEHNNIILHENCPLFVVINYLPKKAANYLGNKAKAWGSLSTPIADESLIGPIISVHS